MFWTIQATLAESEAAAAQAPNPSAQDAGPVRAEAIRAHQEFLADDLLEGRGTGTRGHKLAVNYIRAQCQAAGLQPAGDTGGYFQKVPFVRTIVDELRTSLVFRMGDSTNNLVYGKEFAVLDTHRDTEGGAAAGLAFAGYGVTAPELNYDDYAHLDVRGRIVVMFGFEAPPAFPPDVRAYYNSYELKRANAAAHGAVGIIFIASPATEQRFPWAFMEREFRIGLNSLRWLGADGRPGRLNDSLKVFAALSRQGAEAAFAHEKHTLEEVFAGAEKSAPPRFLMTKSAAIHFHSRHERLQSDNVVARLEGLDPVLNREYVVLSSHLDHLGIGDTINGDSIYNGAIDNASGCAVLLELGRAFAAAPQRPKRSLLFLFVTAEECSVLGSDYFACHPTVPITRIVANINFDGITAFGPRSDVIAWGAEHSSFQSAIQPAADKAGMRIGSDPFPEEGFFIRSDQFSFIRQGVPCLFLGLGMQSSQPGADPVAFLKQWMVTVYHSPKDDLLQPFDYETSARFGDFVFHVSQQVATTPEPPHWKKTDFFAKIRPEQR